MAAQIPAALENARRLLEPSSEREAAVAIAGLLDFARAFAVPVPQAETAARVYADALRPIPPDLLDIAINSTIQSHKWGNRLPLPSEIAAHVAPEIARRRSVVARLEIAQRAPVEDCGPKATVAEIAAVDAIMANWRRERGPDPRAAIQTEEALI